MAGVLGGYPCRPPYGTLAVMTEAFSGMRRLKIASNFSKIAWKKDCYQAQARALYTQFLGHSRSIPQWVIWDVHPC